MATQNETPVAAEETVILKSSDGHEFLISVSAAKESGTINTSLEDCDVSVIPLSNVDGETLGKIIPYMSKCAAAKTDEEKKLIGEQFVSDYKDISDPMFNLTLAANFLELKGLLDALAQKIADLMKNKSVQWVRRVFQVENDFTPEEENQVIRENQWAHDDIDPDEWMIHPFQIYVFTLVLMIFRFLFFGPSF